MVVVMVMLVTVAAAKKINKHNNITLPFQYYHSLSDFVCLAATETHSFHSSEFIRIFPNVRASEFLIVPQPSNIQIISKIEIIDDHVCMRACVRRVLTLLISRELQNDLAANDVRKHTFVFGINLII